MHLTREFLFDQYHVLHKSWTDIAKENNINNETLRYWRRKWGLVSRQTTPKGNNLVDISGNIFGFLTVISRAGYNRVGEVTWNCKCVCGKEREFVGTRLKRGLVISCGCKRHPKGKGNSKWTGYEEISGSYWYIIMHRAKRYGKEVDIDAEYAWKIFLEQERKCIFTGLILTFASNYRDNKSDQTASLDRIDSAKGYIKGNVQWIHKDINIMKLDHTGERFVELCKLVANYN